MRFASSLVMLPLRMLSKNFIGTIILVGVAYLLWPKGDITQPTETAITKDHPRVDAQGKAVPLVDAIKKFQDGNSRFSTDLVSQMTPVELRHYSSVFYWVMRYQAPNKPHRWALYNIHGTMTPFAIFENSFGHQCRKYREILKVHDTQQTFDGMACERTDGGWCRLRADSTPLCGIGESSPMFQGLGSKLKGLF